MALDRTIRSTLEDVREFVPFEAYRSLDFPGAEDLGNMFHSSLAWRVAPP